MTPDRRSFLLAGGATVAGLLPNQAHAADEPEAFIRDHLSRLRSLEVAANKAWWDANTTGKDEDFKRKEEAQNKIDAALADKGMFARVKALYEGRSKIADHNTARQIELLYLQYLE